ncbi:Protein of Unknown Function (DUF239) [Melia azedarach]|uniref:Uncharacterized protein n=1 Tax=Melia azedarach TaxID=155640 RepID=A0ACC1XCY9_MELAZ|nr:Protein of Unknown Function (DUF239) [Melia azedarach]
MILLQMVKRFCSYVLGYKVLVILLVTSGQKTFVDGRKVNHLSSNRHAVKSIQSEDGDIIDCIDKYKQPAFDHPALRNHIIQVQQTMATKREAKTKSSTNRNEQSSITLTSQMWTKNGSCPEGTIPVRRIQNPSLLKSNYVEGYGRKKPSFSHPVKQLNPDEHQNLQQPNHSKAILLTIGYIYSGAKGDIKVWNPYVESDDEYTTSRVCLLSGPYYDYESVESGWAVNPSVYGDRKTRLYVYWTADGSKTTGCFDLTCPGFVQTSKEIALGAAIYPISVPSGLPYQITIYVFKDPNTSNWWVQYGERINIGYWPHELFSLIPSGAESAEWGGEVYSSKLGRPPHTATGMGNGRFPDYVFGNSGSIRRMRILDNSRILRFPEWVFSFTDEYNCYNVIYVGDYIEDPEFYFGGPGRNDLCP